MAKQSLKDIIKIEYQKCAQDPIHFMKKYCYIQHPVRGKIPFHLFNFQERTLTEFDKERYNIVLKSRQTGISTLVAGFSLWKMFLILILTFYFCNKTRSSKELSNQGKVYER